MGDRVSACPAPPPPQKGADAAPRQPLLSPGHGGIEAGSSAPVGRLSPLVPWRLQLLVFLSGLASLATEIAASRLLAPYFGSSTIVWANVIGLVLVYLSVGYWLGGRVADRHASGGTLGRLVLAAAASLAVIPFAAHPILGLAARGLDAVSAGAVVGSFAATLALFSVPVTLLGMVSPFAVRLALRHVGEAGTVAGRLYALSTVGSIAGTFLPAVVTIPLVGTQRTLLGAAVLLGVAAFPLVGWRAVVVTVTAAGLILVPPQTLRPAAGLLFETESPYQYVRVVAQPDGRRELQTNEGITSQSVWRATTALTGGEWDMFLVVPPLLDRPLRRVLVIGNAGGTIARGLATFYPGVSIDGVELDPTITAAARRFLGLDEIPELRVFTDDGRVFLARSTQRYDLVVVDAYHLDYLPYYLATQEFFRLCRQHLTPGGAVALNVARVPGDHRLGDAIAQTAATVFATTWRWPALRYNELVVGLDEHLSRDQVVAREAQLPPMLASLRPLVTASLVRAQPDPDPLTDDRAAIEWLSDRMYVTVVGAGGRLDEHYLPTHP